MENLEKIALSNDKKLIENINSYSVGDDAYWSFKGRSTRDHCHALFQYPAMMVPQMQGVLIDAVLNINPTINSIFDPFVGSGTTLGEAMLRGMDFVGQDINPLAVLACQVKHGPFFVESLRFKTESLKATIVEDFSEEIDVAFNGIDKWFTPEVQLKICKIRRAIKQEKMKWARKFYWLSLSNTVRATSNSRNSTYKLHIKPIEKIIKIPCPIQYFFSDLEKNLHNIQLQKQLLHEKNLLTRHNKASYLGVVDIRLSDARNEVAINEQYDLLISSPPYGDNQTTVPYGQFSYLPLRWIDCNDIESECEVILSNQNSIDSSSLGGSLKNSNEKHLYLSKVSSSYDNCVKKIDKINPVNTKKLTSFIFDLDRAMVSILKQLKPNAYMIWTLGNRRISDIEVPLDVILREILENLNCKYVYQMERAIPSKRMASRNKTAKTMTKESVLIMRK